MTPLRKFFIHFSHFLTGSALSMILGVITFPILTRVLSREEYGVMSLLNTTMFILVAIAKGGLSDGIIRFHNEYSENQAKLTIFSSTIILRGLLLSLLVVVAYVGTLPYLINILGINKSYIICFLVMSVYLLVRPLNIIVLNLLRVNNKTIYFNIVGLGGRVISILLSLLLLIWLIGKLYGYFIGIVLAEIIASIFLFSWFFSRYKVVLGKSSTTLALQLSKFGIPILLTELAYLLLSYADRFMIVWYRGEGQLGLYSVGYNLASYISEMIMFSISYSIIPIYVGIYANEGKEKTEEFLNKCLYYLILGVIPIFFGYLAVSKNLFLILASDKYAEAGSFSPIILLGSFLLGMNSIFNAGLYLQKKTGTILKIMLSAVTLNILLNMILLNRYGVYGAALATLIACIFSAGMTILLSFRYISIKIDPKLIFYYMTLSAVMYIIVSNIEMQRIWLSLLIQILVGILIIVTGVFFREEELVSKLRTAVVINKDLI